MGYAQSPFGNFESYLGIVVGLDEDGIQLVLKHYTSNFVTFERSPLVYSIKDISDIVITARDLERSLQKKFDDKSIKVKLFSTRFRGTFGKLKV